MTVPFLYNKLDPSLPDLQYATDGSAGFDLYTSEDIVVKGHGVTKVPTGIQVQFPPSVEMQIRSRSGLALLGITVANSPGTVDSDYRGEVCVLLRNDTPHPRMFRKGDRIAQAVLSPVFRAEFMQGVVSADTSRGTGGFGSTGIY